MRHILNSNNLGIITFYFHLFGGTASAEQKKTKKAKKTKIVKNDFLCALTNVKRLCSENVEKLPSLTEYLKIIKNEAKYLF